MLAIAFVQSTEVLHVTTPSRASFAPTGLLSQSMFCGLSRKTPPLWRQYSHCDRSAYSGLESPCDRNFSSILSSRITRVIIGSKQPPRGAEYRIYRGAPPCRATFASLVNAWALSPVSNAPSAPGGDTGMWTLLFAAGMAGEQPSAIKAQGPFPARLPLNPSSIPLCKA